MAPIDPKIQIVLTNLIKAGLHHGETAIQITAMETIAGRGRGCAQFSAKIPGSRKPAHCGTISFDIEADATLSKIRQMTGLDAPTARLDHGRELDLMRIRAPKEHVPASRRRAMTFGLLIKTRSA